MRHFMIFVCLLFPFSALTQPEEYISEYTYFASDHDSKLSAREAALQQLQAQVLQRHGVSVNVAFENQETLTGDAFTQTQKLTQRTQAAGITKTQIIDEKWDGQTFYIKAKVIVDSSKSKMADSPSTSDCPSAGKEIKRLSLDLKNPVSQQAAIKISMSHGFESECKAWQFNLMNSLREKNVSDLAYREYLFESMHGIPQYLKGQYITNMVSYVFSVNNISQEEFEVIIKDVQLISKSDVIWLIKKLFENTYINPGEAASNKQKMNQEKKQDLSMLDYQLSYLYQLAGQNKLGFDEKFSLAEIIREVLEIYMFKYSDFFPLYYYDNHQHLNDEENLKFAKGFLRYMKRTTNTNSIEAMGIFIKDVPLDEKINTDVIKILSKIHKEIKEDEYAMEIYSEVIINNKEKIMNMVQFSKLSKLNLTKWKKVESDVFK